MLGLPPGTYEPVAYDGYYAMLAPLSVGPHTIEIPGRGVWLGTTFDTHALYNITIKKLTRERLRLTGAPVEGWRDRPGAIPLSASHADRGRGGHARPVDGHGATPR